MLRWALEQRYRTLKNWVYDVIHRGSDTLGFFHLAFISQGNTHLLKPGYTLKIPSISDQNDKNGGRELSKLMGKSTDETHSSIIYHKIFATRNGRWCAPVIIWSEIDGNLSAYPSLYVTQHVTRMEAGWKKPRVSMVDGAHQSPFDRKLIEIWACIQASMLLNV